MTNATATTRGRVLPTPDPGIAVYGLDIETDTTRDGLDPNLAAVVAVAISSARGTHVIMGAETDLLSTLDERIATLAPGILTTWNGAAFDLPFLAERARRRGVPLGLRLESDTTDASWHEHGHVDGCLLARSDLRDRVDGAHRPSCGLKAMARAAGLPAVEVEITELHHLDPMAVADYVASDAFVARELLLRRWADHAFEFPEPIELAVG